MSSSLGAISSYNLAMQQLQMSLIKNSIDMQKQAVDILLNGNAGRAVSPSENLGTNVDISI